MTRLLDALRSYFDCPGTAKRIAIIAVLISIPSLWGGFATDDHIFLMIAKDTPGMPEFDLKASQSFTFADADPVVQRLRMSRGMMPWWSLEEGRLAFWRPVASYLHWAECKVWGDTAWPMHLLSILVYAAMCAAVCALLLRFIAAPWVAGLAALMYAIDDAHAMPIGWLANRNAVLATLFGVVALILHDRWRKERWKPGCVLAPLCFVAGLLCGESAVAVTGFLFAYALWMEGGPWTRRAATLVPYAVIVVVWRVIYQQLGYGAIGTGTYIDPGSDPLIFLQAIMFRLPVLFFGMFEFPGSFIWIALSPMARATWSVFAAVTLVVLFRVMWPSLKRDPLARFWATALVISAMPACAAVPEERLMLFPAIAAFGLMAQFVVNTLGPERAPDLASPSRTARAFAQVLVALHLVIAPILLFPTTLSVKALGQDFERLNHTIENLDTIDERTLIIVSGIHDLAATQFTVIRSAKEEPVPRRCWVLHTGLGALTVRREADRTLVLRPEDGFIVWPFGQFYRAAREYPFTVGQSVQLDGMRAEVRAITDDDRPLEVAFHFDQALDDAEFQWVLWNHSVYEPFEIPEIGRSVERGATTFIDMATEGFRKALI